MGIQKFVTIASIVGLLGIPQGPIDKVIFVKYEESEPKRVAFRDAPETVESVMTDVIRLSGGR